MKPEISVVIPTLNRGKALVNAVEELLSCASKYLLEIIVVDQSDLPNARLLQRKDTRLIYLNEKIKNLPRARNIGIRRARGDIILFLDDDVEGIENIVDAHADAHLRLKDCVVTGPILSRGQAMISLRDLTPRERAATRDGKLMIYNLDAEYAPLFARGCNCSYPKSMFSQIGLFDENFIGSAAGEDAEMSDRVKRSGRRLVHVPSARLIHLDVPAGGCRNEKNVHARLEVAVLNAHYFHYKLPIQGSFLRTMYSIIRVEVLNKKLLRIIDAPRAVGRFCRILWAWSKARTRTRALLDTTTAELRESHSAGQ